MLLYFWKHEMFQFGREYVMPAYVDTEYNGKRRKSLNAMPKIYIYLRYYSFRAQKTH